MTDSLIRLKIVMIEDICAYDLPKPLERIAKDSISDFIKQLITPVVKVVVSSVERWETQLRLISLLTFIV